MAIEMIMVKGLMEDAVKRLASLRTQVEQRFERIDTRLDAMGAHLGSMDTRLDRVETRLDQIDTRLDRVENMLTQILSRLPEKGWLPTFDTGSFLRSTSCKGVLI
jgi:DNA anti-recombination protein RmuC